MKILITNLLKRGKIMVLIIIKLTQLKPLEFYRRHIGMLFLMQLQEVSFSNAI